MRTGHMWEPVLSGSVSGSAAREAILSIASELHCRDGGPLSPGDLCDQALLFTYLAHARCKSASQWQDRAVSCLNLAAERLPAAPECSTALYRGLCGIGWTMEHVGQLLVGDASADAVEGEADDLLEDVDRLVMRRLERRSWPGPYDLISGLVGIGVYSLERLPRPLAVKTLELVVRHLDDLSETSNEGITWHSPPQHLPVWQRNVCPNGYYNLGVAHGVPGVVAFLGELIVAEIEPVRVSRLLDGAVRWLLARERPSGTTSRFSSWFVPGQEGRDSRLGWCYGDLGIASTLYHTARRLQREEWLEWAGVRLDRCLAWPIEKTKIQDPALCHGAVGVGHIFNRIYQNDGSGRYKEVAIDWYERALMMWQCGNGTDAFQASQRMSGPRTLSEPRPVLNTSFLAGSTGIALALLAATTAVEPSWDRLLLLSGCSR
jgi:hypothetical protein